MKAHASLRLGSLRGTLPSFWSYCRIALGSFVWCGKRDSSTRRLLLPLNAGTAEPFRVSPPEAVAYPLELLHRCSLLCGMVLSLRRSALLPPLRCIPSVRREPEHHLKRAQFDCSMPQGWPPSKL